MWQVYKRGTGRHRDITLLGGLRLRCYPDSASASLALYCGGRPDYHEMGFMCDYLRPRDQVLDVGANVGVYTLIAAGLVGPSGGVDAFEPCPRSLSRLRENLALNRLDHVRVYPHAVGEASGLAILSANLDSMNRLMIGRPIEEPDAPPEGDFIEVKAVRLDDTVANKLYAFGKMDTEGAELMALQGAETMLSSANPPVWLLEVNGLSRDYGYSEAELAAWLSGRGYELASYDSDARRLCFSRHPWLDQSNVLAIAREARDHVVDRVHSPPAGS
jgi:FkbM family methyltransferase